MLENLKILLGIESDDTSCDDKLRLIISDTTAQLKILIGGIEPPESLDYIVRKVSIIRFNKIGSEGMTSHSVEGESIAFASNDFDEFANDIQAFINGQSESSRGKVRFL